MRDLSNEQLSQLIQVADNSRILTVSSKMGDGDARQLALSIASYLQSKGFSVQTGVEIRTPDEPGIGYNKESNTIYVGSYR